MVSLDSDSPLVVYLESVEDGVITNIKSWSMESDYEVASDSFEFVAVDDDFAKLRYLEAQPVKLTVAGVTQMVGRIDQTIRGDDGSAVTCRGRDYLADLIECNVDPSLTIKEKQTLGQAILLACAPIGITKIAGEGETHLDLDVRLGIPGKTKRTKDNKSKPPHQATLHDLKPDLGQGIYEFLKPICAHHRCTIQPTTKRDTLLIAGPHYEQEPAYAIVRNRESNATNNVLSASVVRDYSSFPSMVIVQGQGAPRSGEATASATQVVDTWAQAQHFGGELSKTLDSITWSGRRKPDDRAPLPIDKIYRLNVFRDDKAKSADEITDIAKRLFCEHLKKTLEYRVRLKGHLDPVTGAVWTVNTIVRVSDDICDIHEDLWIQSRKLSFSPQGGATTDLVCIRPDTFDFQPGVEAVANNGAGKPVKREVRVVDRRAYDPNAPASNSQKLITEEITIGGPLSFKPIL